jgi:hypothetical protein
LSSPSEFSQEPSRRIRRTPPRYPFPCGSSLEVWSPSAFHVTEQWPDRDRACLTRSPAPPGFLNLLTLDRSAPASPVSCWLRSWGSPSRAFLLSRSRTPSPAPFPSCRWVRPRNLTTRTGSKGTHPKARTSAKHGAIVRPAKHPPSPGFCSTRKSATLRRLFRPPKARSSPGPFAPPGCSPPLAWVRPSPRLPSGGFLTERNPASRHSRVLLPAG